MNTYIDKIIAEIELEMATIDLFNGFVIESSMDMIIRLENMLNGIREQIIHHTFSSKSDEIRFFKEQKPKIFSRLLFFDKLYQIESRFPNGSIDVEIAYLKEKLDNLTHYFNQNMDFYQYYRSGATHHDAFYFLRGQTDQGINTDSFRLDRDPGFSTCFDHKVAKIIANDMLNDYLNRRILGIKNLRQLDEVKNKFGKSPIRFTGRKVALIEIGYALACSGDINYGNIEIKEIMDFLATVFNVDLGEYYGAYISMKARKKDRTAYLNYLSQVLIKRMDEDDEK